jgi:hypothetical protein
MGTAYWRAVVSTKYSKTTRARPGDVLSVSTSLGPGNAGQWPFVST